MEHTKEQNVVLYTLNVTNQLFINHQNKAFMEQGSVSASANILRKRNNAITNNSASLKTAYGNTFVHKIIDDNNSSYKIQYKKGTNTSQLCNQQFKKCANSL